MPALPLSATLQADHRSQPNFRLCYGSGRPAQLHPLSLRTRQRKAIAFLERKDGLPAPQPKRAEEDQDLVERDHCIGAKRPGKVHGVAIP